MEHVFLDSNECGNSKTFYYLRIAAYHGIPLIVHSEDYAKQLRRECYYEIRHIIPTILSIHDLFVLDQVGRKFICDNFIVKNHRNYQYFEWYTDDEIRDIILTDLSLDRQWAYEKRQAGVCYG